MEHPGKSFSVTLNGETHWATYTVASGVITVRSDKGVAATQAAGEGDYAIAISLLFGILRVARLP